MTTQQDASALTDQTVQALQGSADSVSPTDGVTLINSWVSTLGEDSPLAADLMSLQDELQSSSPDSSTISSLLMSLSQQTSAAASQAGGGAQGSLQQLASALESFGKQIA